MRVSEAYIARLIRDYQKAYEAANDKACPSLLWEGGWFSIGESRRTKYRRTRLEEMLANLRWRAWNERGIDLNQQQGKE